MSSLVLLPLGSDTVRRILPRRTHPAVALKDTSGVIDCQLPSRLRRMALVITIVTSTMAPIVMPNVVFPGCNRPGTGDFGMVCGTTSEAVAAARMIQKNTMIINTMM